MSFQPNDRVKVTGDTHGGHHQGREGFVSAEPAKIGGLIGVVFDVEPIKNSPRHQTRWFGSADLELQPPRIEAT